MSKPSIAPDPYRRHPTRNRGITYRLRVDGSRIYAVSWRGTYVSTALDGVTPLSTEKAALERQAHLRGRSQRGHRVVVNDKTTFSELAESWYEAKAPRLRRLLPSSTRRCAHSAIRLVEAHRDQR